MLADAHQKTPEYTVPGNARKRDKNIDRQETSVYLDSPELTVPENLRRFLQTKEDTIFTKSSSNGEHWKNKRFPAFTRICCQGKCKKTSVNSGTQFSCVYRTVNAGKYAFSRIPLNSPFSENTRKQEKTSVNAGIHHAFRTLTER